MQDGLRMQFNTIELAPVFEECKKEIALATKNVAEVELLEESAESFIRVYFEDKKRQVDLRREELKDSIDSYSNELIQSISDTQLSYVQLSKEANQMTLKLTQSKLDLNGLIEQFDTFVLNDKRFDGMSSPESLG